MLSEPEDVYGEMALAASCLAQDEVKGRSNPKKRPKAKRKEKR